MGFWEFLQTFNITSANAANWFGIVAGVLTFVAGIAGMLSGLVGRIQFLQKKVKNQSADDLATETRLADVRLELERSQVLYRMGNFTATLLTFAQFIVGGVLASSAVHELVPTQTVTWLGILVLVSQLLHQKFRPDLIASLARQRMSAARQSIREIEDQIFLIEKGAEWAPDLFKVRAYATSTLAALEEMELEGLKHRSAHIDTESGIRSNGGIAHRDQKNDPSSEG